MRHVVYLLPDGKHVWNTRDLSSSVRLHSHTPCSVASRRIPNRIARSLVRRSASPLARAASGSSHRLLAGNECRAGYSLLLMRWLSQLARDTQMPVDMSGHLQAVCVPLVSDGQGRKPFCCFRVRFT